MVVCVVARSIEALASLWQCQILETSNRNLTESSEPLMWGQGALADLINDLEILGHYDENVWVVIVTYNSALTIGACLDSLYRASIPLHIVVVDNASTDDTIELISCRYPDVRAIQNAENLGFAGGCNAAMHVAQDSGADFFFFLNPDAEVEPDCANQLIHLLQSDDRLVIACPMVIDKVSQRILYAGADFDVEGRNFDHHGMGELNYGQFDHVTRTGRPTGCAMMVRRSAVDMVGMMDESYFLYWEENEWAWRFIQRGFSVGLCPTSTAHHLNGYSTGGSGSPLYQYYYSRNELRFLAEVTNSSKISILISRAPNLIRRVASAVYRRGIREGFAVACSVALATLDFWCNRYGRRSGLPR